MEGELASAVDKSAGSTRSLGPASKALIGPRRPSPRSRLPALRREGARRGRSRLRGRRPQAVHSIVAKRGALLASAKAVLPTTVKLDGLKAAEIRRQVVATRCPTPSSSMASTEDRRRDVPRGHPPRQWTLQKAQRADSQKALAGVAAPPPKQAAAVAREDGAPVNHPATSSRASRKLGQGPPLTPKAG